MPARTCAVMSTCSAVHVTCHRHASASFSSTLALRNRPASRACAASSSSGVSSASHATAAARPMGASMGFMLLSPTCSRTPGLSFGAETGTVVTRGKRWRRAQQARRLILPTIKTQELVHERLAAHFRCDGAQFLRHERVRQYSIAQRRPRPKRPLPITHQMSSRLNSAARCCPRRRSVDLESGCGERTSSCHPRRWRSASCGQRRSARKQAPTQEDTAATSASHAAVSASSAGASSAAAAGGGGGRRRGQGKDSACAAPMRSSPCLASSRMSSGEPAPLPPLSGPLSSCCSASCTTSQLW